MAAWCHQSLPRFCGRAQAQTQLRRAAGALEHRNARLAAAEALARERDALLRASSPHAPSAGSAPAADLALARQQRQCLGLTARVVELEAELAAMRGAPCEPQGASGGSPRAGASRGGSPAGDPQGPGPRQGGEDLAVRAAAAEAALADRDACLAEAIARLAKTHVAGDKREAALEVQVAALRARVRELEARG